MKKCILPRKVLSLLVILAGTGLTAQDVLTEQGYQEPPQEIKEHVLAPRYENVSLSNLGPDRSFFLNAIRDGLTPIERLAKPYHNFGGIEVDTAANRQRRFTSGGVAGYEFFEWERTRTRTIRTPDDGRVSNATWSPDGSKVAYFVHYPNESHVYVTEVGSRRSNRVTTSPALLTLTNAIEWSADGQYITTIVLPQNRGQKPPYTPDGNVLIQLTDKGKNELRTFPHLLEGPYEKDLFAYYATGQIVRINVDNGAVDEIGDPGLYSGVSMAPDGAYFMVTTIQKPFSNIVPVRMFATVQELWDIDGNVIAELSSRDLRDGRNNDNDDEPQKRQITWRPDGNGLSYLLKDAPPDEEENDDNGNDEAEDQEEEEEEEEKEERMDRVYHWAPPYGEDDRQVIFSNQNEIRDLEYSQDCQTLFIRERERGEDHVYAVFLDEPEEKYTIYKWDTSEFYDNPGSLMTTAGVYGPDIVRQSIDQNHVYLSGVKYHEEWRENAPQPFLDKVEIRNGEKERVFESQEDVYEQPTAIIDDDLNQIVIQRQTPTDTPDSYLRNTADGSLEKLTDNVDHSPEITNAIYKDFDVTRSDGITFPVRAILPQDYQEGEKLPVMFWFYPREYNDQEALDDALRRRNINSFRSIGVRSMQMLLTRGYAVVLPVFPIVGPMDQVNDNFIPSIQRNWHAIIDACDEMGFLDRNRLALGGHSYGAFGTAHSMIQTPYFKAGIAGAGNYNRTLTPITFQRERRVLWEGRESYVSMSPIMYAERLDGALLMYHGADDNNVGTWPINSKRMFHALNGLGKEAALYFYPYEGHGQSGQETLLDMWARWVDWLDKHVKYYDQVEEEEEEENEN